MGAPTRHDLKTHWRFSVPQLAYVTPCGCANCLAIGRAEDSHNTRTHTHMHTDTHTQKLLICGVFIWVHAHAKKRIFVCLCDGAGVHV